MEELKKVEDSYNPEAYSDLSGEMDALVHCEGKMRIMPSYPHDCGILEGALMYLSFSQRQSRL